jgi:GNAT superfamily N-acetyltransferase
VSGIACQAPELPRVIRCQALARERESYVVVSNELRAWSHEDRERLVAWVGDAPETVLAVHALRSQLGRVWITGDVNDPEAALIHSAVNPDEPLGFGQPDALLGLLSRADGWDCVEVNPELADEISVGFTNRWGLQQRVVDVVHILNAPPPDLSHPMVRRLNLGDLSRLGVVPTDLFPHHGVLDAAASEGRVFAAVEDDTIIGHGSSFAAGETYADIGVHVAEPYRRQGIATSAAAAAIRIVQEAGLIPVWGAGSKNAASLRVADKLGFVEVARCVYLVRDND